ANTLRFGGAQLGGAINLVTPTGRTANQRALIQVEGGSYGFVRAHGAVAETHGGWDVYAAATAMQGDGWRDHSQQSQGRLTVNAGRSFGQDREVRRIAQAADIKQDMPGSLPLKQALETPRMASASALSGDQARDL